MARLICCSVEGMHGEIGESCREERRECLLEDKEKGKLWEVMAR